MATDFVTGITERSNQLRIFCRDRSEEEERGAAPVRCEQLKEPLAPDHARALLRVGQEVTFGHDGRDFLEYASHTWVLDNDGNKVRPLESEHGFWRIDADRKVEVTMVRDDGVVEIWYGEMAAQKPQIDLVTDAVARTAASGPYSGGKRLYGYVKSDLMWVGEKQTPEVEAIRVRPHPYEFALYYDV